MPKRILVSAGESSGDLHASNLIKELKHLNGDLEFFGIGCNKMESVGVHLLKRMDSLSIVGVWEIFSKLRIIRDIFKKIELETEKNKTDLAILVDYPGFNLLLAKMLNKKGIPCIYYITPQMWAWGDWRIKKFKSYIKKALVIFKFEEDFMTHHGVPATFVGHPLLDEPYKPVPTKEAKANLGIKPDKFTIALLPGSRSLEVKTILPKMFCAARLIKKEKDVQFILSQSPNVKESAYGSIPKDLDVTVVKSDIHKCLDAADFVFTSSGTVTLQIAIAEKPLVITYITSLLTYVMGRMVIKIPYLGLVNIIARKPVAPELIQWEANPRNMASNILKIISSPEKMKEMKEELKRVKLSLGGPGASRRAAGIINDFLA